MPGEVIGNLRPEILTETFGYDIPVIAIAGHDTGSAVAAVPAANENFVYLSSGTWSLMGIEVKDPIITERSAELNFTSEGGIEGTTRFLKNITGMWVVEQCLQAWKKEGTSYSYPEMVALAEAAPEFVCFIDPDDAAFVAPANMPEAIREYCHRTGQKEPANHGEMIRMIFESLALKYKKTLDVFGSISAAPIERLHVIGGGSRNKLLNQFTANALGLPVIAGPAEATALGNIMMQAKATGLVDNLGAMRYIIRNSIDIETFKPADNEKWEKAYEKFLTVIK